jgi:hypothetical protein
MRRRDDGTRSREVWTTSYVSPFQPSTTVDSAQSLLYGSAAVAMPSIPEDAWAATADGDSSTSKGILIGILSAFGSAAIVAFILFVIWFFQYTQRGRIFLDRLGRPGEYDDEQAFAKEEAEALEEMDDMQRMEYLRAKGASLEHATAFRRSNSDSAQRSSKRTHPNPSRRTFHFLNFSPYKKREFQHGNSSRS